MSAPVRTDADDHFLFTIPGKRPPSVMPRIARTATKPAKFWMKPRHIATMPHEKANKGSQIEGVIRFRTKFEGSSLAEVSTDPNRSAKMLTWQCRSRRRRRGLGRTGGQSCRDLVRDCIVVHFRHSCDLEMSIGTEEPGRAIF